MQAISMSSDSNTHLPDPIAEVSNMLDSFDSERQDMEQVYEDQALLD